MLHNLGIASISLTVLLYCYDSYYMLTESMSTDISHSLISSVTTTFLFTYWEKSVTLNVCAHTQTHTHLCVHAQAYGGQGTAPGIA